jgi:sialidase-1
VVGLQALCLFVLSLWAAAEGRALAAVDVYVSGSGGYNTYRIPAIVRATNGTLLAFCEGRKNSSSDSGDIDLVLRRSHDNGQTWGAMSVVQEEGDTASITIGNPVPVVDETTGRIHLLFCRNNDRVFSTHSDDNGLTWSSRQEITSSVKLPSWGWYATGPGHGIQLKRGAQSGRLIAPSDHNLIGGGNGIQVVYSDDHGATWQLGAMSDAANGVNPNENLAVELVAPGPTNGSRMYFCVRDQNGSAAGNRTEAWSSDGGSSYHLPLTNNTGLVCPVVQGSVTRMRATDEGDSTNLIVFSCPNNASARSNMSVWYSLDEGLNWSAPRSIYSGSSAYSDMVRLTNGNLGILYERDTYGKITFTSFGTDFLGLPPATNQPPILWDGGGGPGTGWGTPANWEGDPLLVFDSSLDVVFASPGAANLSHTLGGDRIIRSLTFNANADHDVSIQLSDSAPTGCTLVFDTMTAGGNAMITIENGATGNFSLGNGYGQINLNDPVLVTHDGPGLLTINRAVTGAQPLTKQGSGVLVLSGANAYTGSTTLNAGTLRLDGSGGLAAASAVAIGANATLHFNRSISDTTWPNDISGTGVILKTVGGGIEFGLTGSNSFSGTIDIQEGKIALAGINSANGMPSVHVASNGTLSIGGGFVDGTATIGNLTGEGRIDPAFNAGSGTRTLQVNQTGDGVFSGVALDATSGRVLALNKTGAATLTLSGTNTYTGPTTVSNGTLVVNGAVTTSAVSVKAGATLAGAGFLGGPVTVEANGILAPGASIGTLTISSRLTLSNDCIVSVEINKDHLSTDRVAGLTNITYGGSLIVTNLGVTPFAGGETFPLFSASGSKNGNFSTITILPATGATGAFDPATGVLTISAPSIPTTPTNIVISVSGGGITLSWPENYLGWTAQSNAVNVADANGWFDIPGSSSVTSLVITPSPTWREMYYRLRSP